VARPDWGVANDMVKKLPVKRRQREELRRSLENAYPETSELAEAGFADWAARLPDEEASDLVDARAGRSVRWVPGRGWIEGK
jgi:hypothetical protein